MKANPEGGGCGGVSVAAAPGEGTSPSAEKGTRVSTLIAWRGSEGRKGENGGREEGGKEAIMRTCPGQFGIDSEETVTPLLGVREDCCVGQRCVLT